MQLGSTDLAPMPLDARFNIGALTLQGGSWHTTAPKIIRTAMKVFLA